MTYHSNDRITIRRAVSQGINPSILILDLKIVEGKGPMKGTPKAFRFKTTKDAKSFSQVTIRYSVDASITVNVEVFG